MKLASIFSNGMVFQANKPARVFGFAEGVVEITFLGETKTAIADGEWLVEFAPHTYGGPFKLEASSAEEKIVIDDIYFGDVFLLAGQSNMQFKLHESNEPRESYKANENIRLFSVDRLEAGEYFFEKDGWVTCTLDTAPYFSAIGYYVAQTLASKHKIGLITMYQGASAIQPWIKQELAIKYPQTASMLDYPLWNDHGVLYDGMLKKILPYSISHVLWYQGESNAKSGEAEIYLDMLTCMISSWRCDFKDENLPFIVIQIADYIGAEEPLAWKTVQEMQMQAENEIKNIKTIMCRDICETNDIHPQSKKALSERIAKAILD